MGEKTRTFPCPCCHIPGGCDCVLPTCVKIKVEGVTVPSTIDWTDGLGRPGHIEITGTLNGTWCKPMFGTFCYVYEDVRGFEDDIGLRVSQNGYPLWESTALDVGLNCDATTARATIQALTIDSVDSGLDWDPCLIEGYECDTPGIPPDCKYIYCDHAWVDYLHFFNVGYYIGDPETIGESPCFGDGSITIHNSLTADQIGTSLLGVDGAIEDWMIGGYGGTITIEAGTCDCHAKCKHVDEEWFDCNNPDDGWSLHSSIAVCVYLAEGVTPTDSDWTFYQKVKNIVKRRRITWTDDCADPTACVALNPTDLSTDVPTQCQCRCYYYYAAIWNINQGGLGTGGWTTAHPIKVQKKCDRSDITHDLISYAGTDVVDVPIDTWVCLGKSNGDWAECVYAFFTQGDVCTCGDDDPCTQPDIDFPDDPSSGDLSSCGCSCQSVSNGCGIHIGNIGWMCANEMDCCRAIDVDTYKCLCDGGGYCFTITTEYTIGEGGCPPEVPASLCAKCHSGVYYKVTIVPCP